MNSIEINAGELNYDTINQFINAQIEIKLNPKCRQQVDQAAAVISQAAAADKPVYGVNTGFGKLASVRIAPSDTKTLQRNLILSHCCGVGEPLSTKIVRLALLLKMMSLAQGASGVRWEIIQSLELLIEKQVTPFVPAQGSVGASGDLAPLAHIAAVMIGEGQAYYQGKLISAKQALQKAGIKAIELQAKEGLALINGTQISTAIALVGLLDLHTLFASTIISGALSVDAAMASAAPFHKHIHILRRQLGQQDVATSLRKLLRGSQILKSHRRHDDRVQDPYCLRCQPQVMGACLDMLRHVTTTLITEANAVTDNPLVLLEDELILSGGNFHAEPVAFAADQMAIAIAEIGAISERRIAMLVDPVLNYGLPAFLTPQAGLNSGFMIAEVTAAALMSENKHKAHPCSIDSTPTSANQEDHVSMATHAAVRILDMNKNLAQIIAIECLMAAQGIELRAPTKTAQVLQQVIRLLREDVAFLNQDRYMANDLKLIAKRVFCGDIIQAIPSPILHNISFHGSN